MNKKHNKKQSLITTANFLFFFIFTQNVLKISATSRVLRRFNCTYMKFS